jgi:hypothetical protein
MDREDKLEMLLVLVRVVLECEICSERHVVHGDHDDKVMTVCVHPCVYVCMKKMTRSCMYACMYAYTLTLIHSLTHVDTETKWRK